jgi:hypothetical protein
MIEANQCEGNDVAPGKSWLKTCFMSRKNTISSNQVQLSILTSQDRISLSGPVGLPSMDSGANNSRSAGRMLIGFVGRSVARNVGGGISWIRRSSCEEHWERTCE